MFIFYNDEKIMLSLIFGDGKGWSGEICEGGCFLVLVLNVTGIVDLKN